MRSFFLLIGLLMTLPVAALSGEAIPAAPTQYVTDTVNALSPAARNTIENELRDYEQTTGHQVIVWIGDTTGDTPLERWTVDAAQKWGIGHKGKDDGAVLFAFMREHKVRIEVGYGLEPELTDAKSSLIIQDVIRPKMRAGDVDGAIQSGVDNMLTAITPAFASHIGHEIATPQPEQSEANMNGLIAVAIFAFIMLFATIIAIIRSLEYVIVLFTRGPAAARKMWHNSWITSGVVASGLSGWSFGGSSGGDFGGGFSGGGGGFGGGGASGGW